MNKIISKMKLQEIKFNPEMLSLAREYRKMTQKDLASLAGIQQAQIAQMENGQVNAASTSTIAAVIEALGFPLSFFLLDESKIGFGSSSIFYRKKSRITASDRKNIQSKVNLHRIGLKKMLSLVDIKPTLKMIHTNLMDDMTPEKAASLVRSTWNLPDGPVQNLTKLLEKAGVIIIECDFETNYIDATSIWNCDLPPIIYINKNLAADRYRFTLAHELGHLVMHDCHNENMEEEADLFASELLLPKQFFSPYAARYNGSPKLADLAKLKAFWKVSIAAIIMRMHGLKYLTDDKRKILYIMMNQQGIRQVEPVFFEKENPQLLQKIFSTSFVDNGTQLRESEAFFSLPEDCVRELYSIIPFVSERMKRPILRIVGEMDPYFAGILDSASN